ncbi:hypothetical protein C0J52_24489 [Blattella germanica]|nr:hypothetical protein C0J52_24489 [Blattella germanica]
MSRPVIVKWCQQFEQSRTDVSDADREGRPSTSTTEDNIQKVDEIIRSNRRVSITEIAQQFSILIRSAHFFVLRFPHGQEADFYRQGIERLVKRSDHCLQRLGDYVAK